MEKFVGIDFGACNIKMAHWRGKGVHTISLSQNAGQYYIPNVILYDMTHAGAVEEKIGDPAKDAQEPENSVEYVKRKLELETWSKPIPNLQRDVSAVDAATDIFRGLSERLQKKLNCEAHELRAVITVPSVPPDFNAAASIRRHGRRGLRWRKLLRSRLPPCLPWRSCSTRTSVTRMC